MRLEDSRRLTGANLYWHRPSAIIDASLEGDASELIRYWEQAVHGWLPRVGYEQEQTTSRVYDGGVSLLVSAPVDVLYSMCELNEVAFAQALAALGQGDEPDETQELARLQRLFDEEQNPRLLALQAEAHQRRIPFLWDDDEVSVGYGKSTMIWTPDQLPSVEDVDWDSLESIPIALVTGTNGKSTTVRMTASIVAAAGRSAGLTSTDFIRVGDRTIDTGDYSGTGGARMLMRQPDVETAVLEVARGGLLRRGLGVERADVSVVTNVAADHLGDYGINTVEELIPAKFIVDKALDSDGTLILNADDTGVVEHARNSPHRIAWFSLDDDNPLVVSAREQGLMAGYLQEGWLVCYRDGEEHRVARVGEIPATRSGVARYNIANALAAMLTAVCLGIEDDAIETGLEAFKGDEHDNPGRGNWFEHEGIHILVDFAHNEHGMLALADMVRAMPTERVILLMGQAGDRLDKDICDLVRAACSMLPDELLVAALPGYERGRELYDVPKLIREEALRTGIEEKQISIMDSPEAATRYALDNARPGDLLVLLALTQREAALQLIHEFIGEADG